MKKLYLLLTVLLVLSACRTNSKSVNDSEKNKKKTPVTDTSNQSDLSRTTHDSLNLPVKSQDGAEDDESKPQLTMLDQSETVSIDLGKYASLMMTHPSSGANLVSGSYPTNAGASFNATPYQGQFNAGLSMHQPFGNGTGMIHGNLAFNQSFGNDFARINGYCQAGDPRCGVPQYPQVMNQAGLSGARFFDEFYHSNPRGLICTMSPEDYFNSFYQAGGMHRLRATIQTTRTVRINGQIVDVQNYNEEHSANVYLNQIRLEFMEQFRRYVAAGLCVNQFMPYNPGPNVSCFNHYNGCVPRYPPCEQPIYIEPLPTYVPPVQDNYYAPPMVGGGCGNGAFWGGGSCMPVPYGPTMAPYGPPMGQSGMNWGIRFRIGGSF